MKKLVLIGSLIAVGACTPAEQQKVTTVKNVVECKIDVLAPYLDYFTSEQFMEALAGKEYFQILSDAGVTPEEIENTVADLKSCLKK